MEREGGALLISIIFLQIIRIALFEDNSSKNLSNNPLLGGGRGKIKRLEYPCPFLIHLSLLFNQKNPIQVNQIEGYCTLSSLFYKIMFIRLLSLNILILKKGKMN